ncbi:MAG TPA: PaaI family thioesterase [Terracidiphilus sp.]|nr:PaaI family thioesterase [Terracidiphilus sp.]
MKPTAENLTPLSHAAQNRCFGCGVANPTGLHLEFFLADDGRVVCMAEVADTFEGPHGLLHGGIIATLLDEIMSKSVRSHGIVAMTRHMEVDYLRPVPSRAPIRIEGRVTRNEGRKHWAEASILNREGKTLAHGKGLFIEVSRSAPDPDPIKDESTPHG